MQALGPQCLEAWGPEDTTAAGGCSLSIAQDEWKTTVTDADCVSGFTSQLSEPSKEP